MFRLRATGQIALLSVALFASAPCLAQVTRLDTKLDDAEKKLDDDIKACRPISVKDYDDLAEEARQHVNAALAAIKAGAPVDVHQTDSDSARAKALRDRAKAAASKPCPPPQKAPEPKQAPVPPQVTPSSTPQAIGGGQPPDQWRALTMEAWVLLYDLDEAYWYCDTDTIKKLIPELEDLAKRVRAAANAARAAGKFSTIKPADAEALADELEDAADAAKKVKPCPVEYKKAATGKTEKQPHPAPRAEGKNEKSSLNDLFKQEKTEKPTPPKYSIVDDIREPPTPGQLRTIDNVVQELRQLTRDFPNLLEGCQTGIWDKHIAHLEDLAKAARQIADDAKRGYSKGVDAKEAERVADDAQKAVEEAKRGRAANAEQWRSLGCPKSSMPEPPAPKRTSALPLQLTPFASRILYVHNQERAAVGAHPLQWDSQLAADATAYAVNIARTGQLVHAPREGRGIERENLNEAFHGSSPDQLMANWINEKRNFSAGYFPNVSRDGNWMDVAHYTQLIWPTTMFVGCGSARGAQWDFFVCRYSPGGNKDGQPVGYAPPVAAAEVTFQPYQRRTEYCSKQEQIDDLQSLQYELIHTDESTPAGQWRGNVIRAEIQRVKKAELSTCPSQAEHEINGLTPDIEIYADVSETTNAIYHAYLDCDPEEVKRLIARLLELARIGREIHGDTYADALERQARAIVIPQCSFHRNSAAAGPNKSNVSSRRPPSTPAVENSASAESPQTPPDIVNDVTHVPSQPGVATAEPHRAAVEEDHPTLIPRPAAQLAMDAWVTLGDLADANWDCDVRELERLIVKLKGLAARARQMGDIDLGMYLEDEAAAYAGEAAVASRDCPLEWRQILDALGKSGRVPPLSATGGTKPGTEAQSAPPEYILMDAPGEGSLAPPVQPPELEPPKLPPAERVVGSRPVTSPLPPVSQAALDNVHRDARDQLHRIIEAAQRFDHAAFDLAISALQADKRHAGEIAAVLRSENRAAAAAVADAASKEIQKLIEDSREYEPKGRPRADPHPQNAEPANNGPLIFDGSPIHPFGPNPRRLEFGDDAIVQWQSFDAAWRRCRTVAMNVALSKLKYDARAARELSSEERAKGNDRRADDYRDMADQLDRGIKLDEERLSSQCTMTERG